jgi:hypothetical protein
VGATFGKNDGDCESARDGHGFGRGIGTSLAIAKPEAAKDSATTLHNLSSLFLIAKICPRTPGTPTPDVLSAAGTLTNEPSRGFNPPGGMTGPSKLRAISWRAGLNRSYEVRIKWPPDPPDAP